MYLTGSAGAYREMLWDAMGGGMRRDENGRLDRYPREYWCPCIRIGRRRIGVIGPNPDGSSGAPVGYTSRKAAIENAQRFLDRCRQLLAESQQ